MNSNKIKLIQLLNKEELPVYPYIDASAVQNLDSYISEASGVCKLVNVEGTFKDEETITGTLTSDQLTLLKNDYSILQVTATYEGEDIILQFNDFADNGNYRHYAVITKNFEIIAYIDLSSGSLTCSIDYNYGNEELIISSDTVPVNEGNIGVLNESTIDGTLYSLKYKAPGLYDEYENLLVTWNDSGIDETCSNAGEIISTNYSKTRIVRISSDVTTLSANGWVGADMVTKVLVPDSVTYIACGAFSGMIALEEISLPFCGSAIDATGVPHTFGIIFNQSKIDGTTACQQYINSTSYHNNYVPTSLNKVIIRNSSTSGIRGFCGIVCPNLTDVVLTNCTRIENLMFRVASYIKNIELHCSSDCVIEAGAFYYSGVEELVLPYNVTTIAGLNKVKVLYCQSNVPPSLTSTLNDIETIYVPETALETYKLTWTDYANKIEIGEKAIPSFDDELKEWKNYWDASQVKKYVESKEGLTILIDVTYNELISLMASKNLVPGCHYRITDYNFVPKSDYSVSISTLNNQFDLIVLATTTSTINDNAKAIIHEDTTYFTAESLAMWEIIYTVNNWLWTDSTNGKGTIMWMKDDNGNQAPYDFKNLTYIVDDKAIPTFALVTDDSYTDYSINNKCYGNIINHYVSNSVPTLNNIKLISTGDELMCNTFENNCHDILVYDSNDTLYNDNSYDITGAKGSSISSSKFSSKTNNVTLTGFINSFICGDNCSNLTLSYLTHVNLGANCANITITGKNYDEGNVNIILGANCDTVSIGILSNNITIGNKCRYVYILQNSSKISIGNNSSYIKLGTYSEQINFEGNANYYIDYGYSSSDSNKREYAFFSSSIGLDTIPAGQEYRKMAVSSDYDDSIKYKYYIKDVNDNFITYYYDTLLRVIGYISADSGTTWTNYDPELIKDYERFNEEHPVNSRIFVYEGDSIPEEKYAKYINAYGVTFELDDTYNGRVIQCDNTQDAGTLIAESLPKIEGTVSVGPRNYTTTTTDEEALAVYNLSGAFTGTKNNKNVITDINASFSRSGAETQANVINFKASDSNTIYSGDKVQPLAVTCKVYKRTT